MESNSNIFEINRDLIYVSDLPSYAYFIGQSVSNFEDQLPRGIDVLRYYYHFQFATETEKIANITNRIQEIYDRAGISTIHIESIRTKVKRLISSVRSIIETRKSTRPNQIKKEATAFQKIIQLFEVVDNEDWLPVTIKEFLFDQRTVRQKFVTDVARFHRVDRISLPSTSSSSNVMSQFQRVENQIESPDILPDLDEMLVDDDSPDQFDFDTSPDFEPDNERNKKRIQLCDEDLETLSKCGGSYRIMEKTLAVGIRAAGGNPDDFAISKTSLCDQLNKRRSVAKPVNLEMVASNNEKVVILFDGKKFSKINAKHVGKDSRMVAICHTQTKDIALGLPILVSGHARMYVNELLDICENYDLLDRLVGFIFDTQNVNTGQNIGVCTTFETETGKEILNIACRHHILERLLSSAMAAVFGGSEAPTFNVFDLLRDEWPHIKSQGFAYEACDEDWLSAPHLQNLFEDAKEALINHAKSKHIRDDYAEITDLCLKFLGVQTKKSFMVPGSNSRARWMAKAIYALKMYLFRHLLDLDPEFERNLLEFSVFVALIYCKYWNRCTNAVDAPINDLSLIADLNAYADQNETIANAVLNTLWNHLWYLGEELVVLSLFSEKVSTEIKNRMRVKLMSNGYSRRSVNSLKLINYVDGIELPDLLSSRSQFFISILEIDSSFLRADAATWKNNISYKKSKKLVEDLIVVVNDIAERSLGKAATIVNNQKARSEVRLQDMFLSLFH